MLTVSKQCFFDASHVLAGHAGECRNLHGHTYRVVVEVAPRDGVEADPETGMVIDFKDLKRELLEVVGPFDHAFLYDERSGVECEIAAVLAKHGLKSVRLPFRTTAENLARHLFQALAVRVNVVSVQVYETPDSCASFRAG